MQNSSTAVMETRLTRLQARTLLAERLEQHFGERLVRLVELERDPYEDGEEGELFLVVVLRDEGYDRLQARREALGVQNEFDADTGFEQVSTVYVLSASELEEGQTGVARAARAGGALA